MAKIDGVLNNFVEHVTSGLSGFITAGYDACERVKKHVLRVKLLPNIELEQAFAEDAELVGRVLALQQKFLEIMQGVSKMRADHVAGLMVEVDFAWDPAGIEKRRRELAQYYRHSPVYQCTVSVRLASGRERNRTKCHS